MTSHDRQSDVKLLNRLRLGDAAAAEIVVQRLSDPVSRLVFRLTGWHSEIDDLVQDVFLQIQKKAASFEGRSTLETWATAITLNRCRNWHRSNANRPVLETMPESVQDPSSAVHSDTFEIVHDAMRKLKPEDRELVVLRYLEGKSLDEISDLLNQRKNTVEVRLHRIRNSLKNVLSASVKGLNQ